MAASTENKEELPFPSLKETTEELADENTDIFTTTKERIEFRKTYASLILLFSCEIADLNYVEPPEFDYDTSEYRTWRERDREYCKWERDMREMENERYMNHEIVKKYDAKAKEAGLSGLMEVTKAQAEKMGNQFYLVELGEGDLADGRPAGLENIADWGKSVDA